MLPVPALPARLPRPITDGRLAQAHAAEELLESILKDLYYDMQNGAPIPSCIYVLVERLRPPPAVVCIAGGGAKRKTAPQAFRRNRDPEPITHRRLEQAFAAEHLRDTILDDLYLDAAAGETIIARRFVLLWRPRPVRAITLALQYVVG